MFVSEKVLKGRDAHVQDQGQASSLENLEGFVINKKKQHNHSDLFIFTNPSSSSDLLAACFKISPGTSASLATFSP